MVPHAYYLSILEAEEGGSRDPGHLGLHRESLSKKLQFHGMDFLFTAWIPSYNF
jgi:hypothetical protein